jgi:hypothetical protein
MENSLQELTELIKNGTVSPKNVINITEQHVKDGTIEPEFLTYMVKYLSLINILNANEYINIQELVNLGFYDSIEEIEDILYENKEEFKDKVFNFKPCNYPEPTIEEINENVDDKEKNCIICCIRIKKTVFIPCGHSVCCTVCSKTIAENSKKEGKRLNCLLCKKQVDNINKLYI